MTKDQKLARYLASLVPRSPLQIPIYKFVSRRNLDRFFDTGSIRIGTLHDFRKTEAHGKWRGDEFEGKSDIMQRVASKNQIDKGSFLSTFINAPAGVQITDCIFIERRDFPNCYVFCTSSYFTDELFQHWHEKEGVDACYEIFDWIGYHREISHSLVSRADGLGSAYVTYVEGDIDGESEGRHIYPPFIKKMEYEWQSEFRGVWLHKAPSIDVKPLCFEIPDARKYCRPYAILNAGKIQRL